MKLVISPAKSLNYTSELPTKEFTQSCFLKEAETLNDILKNKSPNDLSKLMSISSSLGDLNYERNQSWSLPFSPSNSRQAIYAFNGDVYKGIDAYSIPANKIELLQNTVRIISGLYGILKPLDLVQPYRLEMGTKLITKTGNNLYKFWENRLHKALLSELKNEEEIINLASEEYSKAIQLNKFNNPVITPVFKDRKNGKLKVISFFAKRARGEMANFIIKNKIKNSENLKSFSNLGYQFTEGTKKGEFLFTR